MEDPHTPKYRFLNVLWADGPAAAKLTVLHAALNDAPAADYAAHLTVARFGAVYSAKALERQIGPLTQPAVGRIAALQVLQLENRSEEHTSELQSLMRISYAVFCLKKKKNNKL